MTNTLTDNNLNFKVDPIFAMELTMRMYHAKFEETWTREGIQNSVDARATKIDISNHFDEEKMTSIMSIEDNGHGMTADVIYNKFLALGGSHKQKDDNEEYSAIGGFGIAKTIVLGGNVKYPNPYGEEVRWYVETTSMEKGSLSSYYLDSEMIGKTGLRKIATQANTGTKIVIFRKRERKYHHKDLLLTNIIENCNVIPIRYNGEELMQLRRAQEKDISHLFTDEIDTSWLEVRHKKTVLSHQENHVIFRIRGIHQFQQWESNIPGSLIIEIKSKYQPNDEAYPLTPNREQIKDDNGYRDVVKRVIDYFKVYQEDKHEEDYKLEIFENPNFNSFSYDSYYKHTAKEEIEESTSIMQQKNNKEETLEFNSLSEDNHLIEETIKAENDYEKELEEKEEETLSKYEKQRKYLEQQRDKTAAMEKTFAQIIEEMKTSEDEQIYRFRSVFTSQLPSISIKQSKDVKSNIDLYNMKNIKTLLAFKVFIDLFFELAKEEVNKFEYKVGWSLNAEGKRVEFFQKDYEYFILLNPIGLNISNIRVFTNTILQKLVFEILNKDYYAGNPSFHQKYFKLMEEVINPNIRIFERTAKKILKNN